MKTAFITGITGQDGTYLTELLLAKGYAVHGLVRPATRPNTEFFADKPVVLHIGDLMDSGRLNKIIGAIRPDEVYNLASQSHVGLSFDNPIYTSEVTGVGTLKLLEAVRQHCPEARFYQASTSEMFGNAPAPQNELTPLRPRNPYGAAKTFAHHMCQTYRKGHIMFISCGILFNHESPRRRETFVSRKITKAVARIATGVQNTRLELGNLDAKRDWGYAPEYVQAIWEILQLNAPEDFVIATGETHSVREFVVAAFGHVGLDWQRWVVKDQGQIRPTEIDELRGNYSKATMAFGWAPTTNFYKLVQIMMDADMAALKNRVQDPTITAESRTRLVTVIS